MAENLIHGGEVLASYIQKLILVALLDIVLYRKFGTLSNLER